ncbi:SMI1/KNR4 family protein [Pinirhizobacter soli]|uniref:SMI1/KNR4 family protein n=1 Tax=Pinirhizobacter soli TaxID=2786953 RepID=UPI002029BAA1|nr:SMI1/KNR4 family protein [Pinirhizobacter soli]
MTINSTTIAMRPVLHPRVTPEEARWNSIAHLLDEAEAWVAPGKLKGLADHEILHAWHKVCPNHEVPPALAEFLYRAGKDAPFINSDFEDSYRPEHYEVNRDFADRFLSEFPSGDSSTVLHRHGEDGKPSSSVVVIACNVQRQDYYCVDVADNDPTVFWVHDDHGDLKEEATTMLDFLRLELINYWLKVQSSGV